MDQMEVMKIVNRKMKPKEQIIKIKMKESLEKLPKFFPREKKIVSRGHEGNAWQTQKQKVN